MEARKHILIVDDDVELANLLAQAVNDVSDAYDVKVAKDVDGAMVQVHRALTASYPFDLVITDIKMIGLSGLELLEALRSIAPETKTITMTAYNSAELAERAQQLGVFAYLTKPFVLSEFRQIVHSALYPDAQQVPVAQPTVPRVEGPRQVTVQRHLATLRAMTGASIAALVHANGTVLVRDCAESNVPLDALCVAITGAQREVANQLGSAFGEATTLRQSYFGTETHNVCTYALDSDYLIVVFFGPAVKEGQVWYYVRDAARRIRTALSAADAPIRKRSGSRADDLMEMIERYLPRRKDTPRARPAPETPSAPARQEPQPESSHASTAPVMDLDLAPVAPDEDLPPVDDIDWDVPVTTDWDDLVANTDQGFAGISYEQAVEQGLLAGESLPAPAPQAAGPASNDNASSIDDIDWNAEAEVDWDESVADVDPNFDGITLGEARKRGLIGDLDLT